jgi:hypothetical protein
VHRASGPWSSRIYSSQIPREQGRASGRRVGEARAQQHGLRRLGRGTGGAAAGLEILDLGDFPGVGRPSPDVGERQHRGAEVARITGELGGTCGAIL